MNENQQQSEAAKSEMMQMLEQKFGFSVADVNDVIESAKGKLTDEAAEVQRLRNEYMSMAGGLQDTDTIIAKGAEFSKALYKLAQKTENTTLVKRLGTKIQSL